MFVTKYNYEGPCEEAVSDELKVERAGYVPAKKQIENMIYSGQRLVAFRNSEFGGTTDAEAEADYTGIDSCTDFVDVDNCVRQYAAKRAAASDAQSNTGDNNGVDSAGESVES